MQSARFLCPWDYPGKDTGVGGHFFLQGIFLTQESNSRPLHCRRILSCWATRKATFMLLLFLLPKTTFSLGILHLMSAAVNSYCSDLQWFIFLSTHTFHHDAGLGHATCCSQWNSSKRDVNWALGTACVLKFAISCCSWKTWDHHYVNNPRLACFKVVKP